MPNPLDYESPAVHPANKRKPTVLLKALACVIIGTAIGAVCSFCLWLALGGWGPPDGFILVVLGLVLGLVRANAISGNRGAG